MAITQIPNTNTFSLQDVADYFSKSGDNDLISLIDAANHQTLTQPYQPSVPEQTWDPNYKGNTDRLSNFRNYSGPWVGKLQKIRDENVLNKDYWQYYERSDFKSVAGYKVNIVLYFRSGDSDNGALQISPAQIGNVNLITDINPAAWQTSTANEEVYANAVFSDLEVGQISGRWNKYAFSPTSTPASVPNGLPPPPYAGGPTSVFLAPTKGVDGHPNKNFWLKSSQEFDIPQSFNPDGDQIAILFKYFAAANGDGWNGSRADGALLIPMAYIISEN